MIVKPCFVNIETNEICKNEQKLFVSKWQLILDTLNTYCSYSGKNWFQIWWDADVITTNLIHIDIENNNDASKLDCVKNAIKHICCEVDLEEKIWLIFEIAEE